MTAIMPEEENRYPQSDPQKGQPGDQACFIPTPPAPHRDRKAGNSGTSSPTRIIFSKLVLRELERPSFGEAWVK